MKKLIAILTASIVFVSCSKDSEQINAPVEKKIRRVNYQDGNYAEVTYYPDGKVKDVVTKAGAYLYTKTFTHSPAKTNYISMLAGKKSEIGEFTIVNGKVTDFTWTYYDANEQPINTFHETFEYNAQGLLSKQTYTDGAYYTFVYNADGDLTEQVYHNANGIATNKGTYTYSSKINKQPWFSEEDDSGHGFLFPAENKHLRITEHGEDLVNATVTYHYDISHELDADGYVIKSTFVMTMGGNGVYTVTNDYQ